MDNLLLSSRLDQSDIMDNTCKTLLDQVEDVINKAKQFNDIDVAINMIYNLVQVVKGGGIALAKSLYLTQEIWGVDDNISFYDLIFDRVGLHRHTTERYIKIWAMFTQGIIPYALEDKLQNRNIKDLVPIAHAIAQGYEVSQDDWKELAYAPDFATVSTLIRDIKNVPPRKNALSLSLNRDGDIHCYQNDQRYFVGYLDVKSLEDPIKKSIERIIKNAGILQN